MRGRRVGYLTILLGSLVFFGLYQQWLSWLLLLMILVLPWLSLCMSLPAMLTVRAEFRCPKFLRMGMPARTAMDFQCKFPTPPIRCELKLRHSLSDVTYVGQPGEMIPTEHCGVMSVSVEKFYVYDYLGLFRRRLHRDGMTRVYIYPKPVATEQVPILAERAVSLWRPKPGGGFSENHDLRLYRPGDDLRNLHWKMSAKTGKFIYREPIEPVQKGRLLTLTLNGTPAQLDCKLGQLTYLAEQLLAKQMSFDVLGVTGNGTVQAQIADKASLEACLQQLLEGPTASADEMQKQDDALWQHHIGGDSHEA